MSEADLSVLGWWVVAFLGLRLYRTFTAFQLAQTNTTTAIRFRLAYPKAIIIEGSILRVDIYRLKTLFFNSLFLVSCAKSWGITRPSKTAAACSTNLVGFAQLAACPATFLFILIGRLINQSKSTPVYLKETDVLGNCYKQTISRIVNVSLNLCYALPTFIIRFRINRLAELFSL